jgi:hypothetical protein
MRRKDITYHLFIYVWIS